MRKDKCAFIQTPQDFWNVAAGDPLSHSVRFFYGEQRGMRMYKTCVALSQKTHKNTVSCLYCLSTEAAMASLSLLLQSK